MALLTLRGTILLMHGIPTWGYLYHAVIPRLVDEGYRVVAPDFLGHGWSDRRDRFDRSFQDQARMIKALLAALKELAEQQSASQTTTLGDLLAEKLKGQGE